MRTHWVEVLSAAVAAATATANTAAADADADADTSTNISHYAAKYAFFLKSQKEGNKVGIWSGKCITESY